MTDAELLPCPFCGGPAKLYYDDSGDYERHWSWLIECSGCECDMTRRKKEDVIAAWNKRDWSAAMAIVHSVHSTKFVPTTMTTTNHRNISTLSSSTTVCAPVGWRST
jgi:Lar family restriction alleviation protein